MLKFGIFALLITIVTFVNKYVLSILLFQYPTIFQAWQTFVGFIVIQVLLLFKKPKENISWLSISKWLPAMIFFVTSIYSGSIALSKLSIPVFLSLQNISFIFSAVAICIDKKVVGMYEYISIMILITSSLCIGYYDTEFDFIGYKWMAIHIFSLGCYKVYRKCANNFSSLGHSQQIYCNYLYSIVILIPLSYFTGDMNISYSTFNLWFYSKFYIGCLLSGVFGVGLQLLNIEDKQFLPNWLENSLIDTPTLYSTSKLIVSLLSLTLFPNAVNTKLITWVLMNQLSCIVCTLNKQKCGAAAVELNSG